MARSGPDFRLSPAHRAALMASRCSASPASSAVTNVDNESDRADHGLASSVARPPSASAEATGGLPQPASGNSIEGLVSARIDHQRHGNVARFHPVVDAVLLQRPDLPRTRPCGPGHDALTRIRFLGAGRGAAPTSASPALAPTAPSVVKENDRPATMRPPPASAAPTATAVMTVRNPALRHQRSCPKRHRTRGGNHDAGDDTPATTRPHRSLPAA